MKQSTTLLEALHAWSDLYMQQSMAGLMHYMRKNGLSFSQISILIRLKQHGASDIISLSKEMQISKAGAGQLIQRMQKAGWVERNTSISDKRCRMVTLSAAGETLVQDIIQAMESWQQVLAVSLQSSEHETLIQALNTLTNIGAKLTQRETEQIRENPQQILLSNEEK
jgi:DNA-binding MarR family transcriptional regulator